MNSTPESYAAEWSTLTGRPTSDVYIPVDIRPGEDVELEEAEEC